MAASGGMASALNPGTLSPGNASAVNLGQLIPAYRSGNYFPRALAVVGPGGISSGITNPAFPPQSSQGVFGPMGAGGAGSGSVSGSNAQQASTHPFDPRSSAVPWLIGALLVGALMMHFVHHGY